MGVACCTFNLGLGLLAGDMDKGGVAVTMPARLPAPLLLVTPPCRGTRIALWFECDCMCAMCHVAVHILKGVVVDALH